MMSMGSVSRSHAWPRRPLVKRPTRALDLMPCRVTIITIVASLLGLVPSGIRAQSGTGRLMGVVVDSRTGAPIVAEITMLRPSRALQSDSSGRFLVDALPLGEATVRVRAIGYGPVDVTASILLNRLTTIAVRLTESQVTLQPVRTFAKSPERERFEELSMPSVLSIGAAERARVPVAGERDVLRAATLLPGVAARNDYSAGINVRGGEADQNLVLLDGIPIYNPFHFGGLFGTLIDAAVSRIDVYSGAFPSQYGGRLSSVLDVASQEEAQPGLHGTTDASLLSSSAVVGGALAGGRVSWNLGGRRMYADRLIEAITGTNDFPYHFQDAQFHARVVLPNAATLSITAYGGNDFLSTPPDGQPSAVTADSNGVVGFDWGNRVAGITYTQPFGLRTTLTQQFSISGFSTHFSVPSTSMALGQTLQEVRVAGHLSRLVGTHTLGVGYEAQTYDTQYRELFRVRLDAPTPDALATSGDTTIRQSTGATAAFLDDLWKPNERLLVRPGLRLEHVAGAGWTGISPRVSVKYFLSHDLAMTAAIGRYAQWMRAMRNEDLPIRVFDLWVASDSTVPVSTATHAVLGLERWFGSSRFVRVEAYDKRFTGLAEPASTIDPRIRPSLLRYFDGRSYGVDFIARQMERGAWSGWVSYGYGLSWRERDDVRYFPAQDRRHNANVVIGYAPSARYAMGLRIGVASGTPYTSWAGVMQRWQYDPILKTWVRAETTDDNDIVHGARNAARLPLYSRVDFSIERRFDVGRAIVRPQLSLVNVMNYRNAFVYALDPATNPLTVREYSQFPLLPSLGVRVEF
jgi:hypothetical protein